MLIVIFIIITKVFVVGLIIIIFLRCIILMHLNAVECKGFYTEEMKIILKF